MINTKDKINFDTLCLAIQNGDTIIMECYDKVQEKNVVVICAIVEENGSEAQLVPFAELYSNSNPFDRLVPSLPHRRTSAPIPEAPKAKSDSRLN